MNIRGTFHIVAFVGAIVLNALNAQGGEWIFSRSSADSEGTALVVLEVSPMNDPITLGDFDQTDDGSPIIVGTGFSSGTAPYTLAVGGAACLVMHGDDGEDTATLTVDSSTELQSWPFRAEGSVGAIAESDFAIVPVSSSGTFTLKITILMRYSLLTSGGYGVADRLSSVGAIAWLDDFDTDEYIGIGGNPDDYYFEIVEYGGSTDFDYFIEDGDLHAASVSHTWTGLSSADLPTVHFLANSGTGGVLEGGYQIGSDQPLMLQSLGVEITAEILPD